MFKFSRIIRTKGLSYIISQIENILHLDKELISLISRCGAYRYLTRYKYVLEIDSKTDETEIRNLYPDKTWVCWLQGIEDAPMVVKECINSMEKFSEGREVILITVENMDEYIKLPDYIIQKWQKKIISNTHFSDLIRITLLYEYGGIWIDSTTLLTGSIPDYIKKADLFCYKGSGIAKVIASNWFIAAKPRHEVIGLTRNLLYEYWKKENKLISYSIFHLFFTMVVESGPRFQKLWKEVPAIDDSIPKLMQNELFDPFSRERLKQICQLTTIHKLSYKYSCKEFEESGTFYEALIKNDNDSKEKLFQSILTEQATELF